MENSCRKSRKITECYLEVITKFYTYPDITKCREVLEKQTVFFHPLIATESMEKELDNETANVFCQSLGCS